MASGACSFRVIPAAGDDEDLNEAARLRRMHEKTCRFRGLAEPIAQPIRNTDDRRGLLATRRLELEEREQREREQRTDGNGRVLYNREPTGIGWDAAIEQYLRAHPGATVEQIALALNCKHTTAATYAGAARARIARR